MSTRKKKPKYRRVGNRCLLCRRKAVEGLACEKHKGEKVDLKHFVLPYVIVEQPEPHKVTQARTLYGCARCGYQLLPAEEAQAQWSSTTSRGGKDGPIGTLLTVYVCKNAADCARRIGDLVAGKQRVRACAGSLTL
jgi:hypothetical protein